MGMPRLRHVPALLFVTATAILAACSAASPPAPQQPTKAGLAQYPESAGARGVPGQYAPPAPPATASATTGLLPPFEEPPAADVPGLEAQLERAEKALGLALGAASQDAVVQGGNGAVPSPAATPGGTVLADPCLVACAALASMKRSADHLCGMAGEKDAACGGARERVQRAEQRVVQSCPACAAQR